MKLAFVSGLSDKKLAQKLDSLQALPLVEEILLFRRAKFTGEKITWMTIPKVVQTSRLLGDIWRFFQLLIHARRYDAIIACHQSYHGLIAWAAGLLRGKQVIQLTISSIEWVHSSSYRRMVTRAAVGHGVRGEITRREMKALGYKAPIEVIPNVFTPQESLASEVSHAYDLLAVGDYAEAKDYPWMLTVLGAVNRELPGVRLAIAGRGDFRGRLGSLMDEYDLHENVEFLGWCDETRLAEAYGSSRALLLTSRREGLPMVVLEAMAHGLPILCTSVGELPWLIRDHKEGRVVAHGATEDIVSAIIDLLSDPAALEELGRNARRRLEELLPSFTTEAVAETWRRLLEASIQCSEP